MAQDIHATITLRWNAQKQAHTADVAELPGSEGSGTSYEAALASVLEAIRWW